MGISDERDLRGEEARERGGKVLTIRARYLSPWTSTNTSTGR